MTARHCLEVQGLAKKYRRREIIRWVDLKVESGEIVGLLGPNGCGKTTCFYMIIGLVRGHRGKILVDQQEVTRTPMHVRARRGIGYLPQEASIFRRLSVRDNLLTVLELRHDLNRAQRHARCAQLLEEFHIAHLCNTLGGSLSGGERRRVETARALASDPHFLLLDEPFAGVDPISIDGIRQIVRQLQQRGVGVLITDHNVRETLGICDRIYILGEGEVIASGTREAILANMRVRKSYLGEDFRF